MRPLSVAVWGTVVVAAGMAVPTGHTATSGRDGVTVRPGPVRPGQRVEVSVPACAAGRSSATSPAFTGPVRLERGRGAATVGADVASGTYPVVVRCGGRDVSGQVRVSGGFAWRAVLPTVLAGDGLG
ncbi:MAG TPA: hypothetical protein VIL71_06285 [Spirillospora sp.]